jgi:hypothetical protein
MLADLRERLPSKAKIFRLNPSCPLHPFSKLRLYKLSFAAGVEGSRGEGKEARPLPFVYKSYIIDRIKRNKE